MGALLELLASIIPGLGVAYVADKVLPSQTPNYQPVGIGWNLKTVVITVSFLAGGLLLIFLAKTFNIKIFKSRK
jgi:hypothetical protein